MTTRDENVTHTQPLPLVPDHSPGKNPALWVGADIDKHPGLFDALDDLGAMFHSIHSIPTGFRDDPQRTLDRELMLIMSEAMEMFEDVRSGKTHSDHIPEYSPQEEEAADMIIRILEAARARNWRIGGAVMAKFKFNLGRPYKHGKAF